MSRGNGTWLIASLVLPACSGFGPDLPGWLFEEGTTVGTSTGVETVMSTMVADESTSTTDAGSSTGPVAECGNRELEEGEACDGTELNGATCGSLGQSSGTLSCTEDCAFNVSGCVPPGMVLVPGGVFEMGSNHNADEMPIRLVQVDAFWVDETEVTLEAYAGCVDAGTCSEPSAGTSCNWTVAGRDDHPVNCVTWFQAEDFCAWTDEGTKRLPTEAEWEKAARGPDAREYPWGDIPAPSCAQVVMNEGGSGCGMSSTWPVKDKPMGDSPYGVHDMAGNAWEWVADWYADTYDAAETDNPTGPEAGTSRVRRGGAWTFPPSTYFRAAYRSGSDPTFDGSTQGFRCARTPPTAL